VERELAQQDSQSPWLDAIATPGGEPIQATSCGRALLQACMHLLAWGKTRWDELARYGLNERLRFLWQWGAKRGYARLV